MTNVILNFLPSFLPMNRYSSHQYVWFCHNLSLANVLHFIPRWTLMSPYSLFVLHFCIEKKLPILTNSITFQYLLVKQCIVFWGQVHTEMCRIAPLLKLRLLLWNSTFNTTNENNVPPDKGLWAELKRGNFGENN